MLNLRSTILSISIKALYSLKWHATLSSFAIEMIRMGKKCSDVIAINLIDEII